MSNFRVGQKVEFRIGKGTSVAKIISLSKADNRVELETDKGKKVVRPMDKISSMSTRKTAAKKKNVVDPSEAVTEEYAL